MKTSFTAKKLNKVYFLSSFPSLKRLSQEVLFSSGALFFVVCDRKLKSYPKIQQQLKGCLFYFPKAGEQLKSLSCFPKHVDKILRQAKNKKISCFISIGGGSVGDFTGFLASCYHRSTPVIHIPSTWIAALDSAYGGKTALNINGVKNILGSYHFAQAVFVVKELLFLVPPDEVRASLGEWLKTALLSGEKFYSRFMSFFTSLKKNSYTKSFGSAVKSRLWKFLPEAVFYKLEIVKRDPYDKKGIRCVLNFGHTLGHILEAFFRLPHGEAVLYGLIFSIRWSQRLFSLPPDFLKNVSFLKQQEKKMISLLKKIPPKELRTLLLKDKKRISSNEIKFVFIKGPGRPEVSKITVQSFLKEIKRQILNK